MKPLIAASLLLSLAAHATNECGVTLRNSGLPTSLRRDAIEVLRSKSYHISSQVSALQLRYQADGVGRIRRRHLGLTCRSTLDTARITLSMPLRRQGQVETYVLSGVFTGQDDQHPLFRCNERERAERFRAEIRRGFERLQDCRDIETDPTAINARRDRSISR